MKPFRVAFLADSQLGMYATFSGMSDSQIEEYRSRGLEVRKAPHTTGFEWDSAMYRRAVDQLNALRPDLVVFGGDMIDDPNSDEQIDEFMAITRTLDPDIPMRWAPGNHDIGADTVVPTHESVAAYREVFGPDFFLFEMGPVRFVVLNTTVVDHPELVPDEWKAQREFLEEVLGDPHDRETVVVGHHPFFLESIDEDDSYWNLPRVRRLPLLQAMRQGGVRLILSGHWHRNNITKDGDLEMVASGPVGYPLGQDPSGFRMVEFGEGRPVHHYVPITDR